MLAAMNIIPVLDLRGGRVVRAVMGERHRYRPIASKLAPTADPAGVMRGLLSVNPFDTFYIADLDAIEGTGDNLDVLVRLRRQFSASAFWVDNGVNDVAAAERWLGMDLGHLVIGSEAQDDAVLVRHMAQRDRIVLSLDFRGPAFKGPPALVADAAPWPARVIVMTLTRVGSGRGPDRERLQAIRAMARGRAIYAAGGVRGGEDLAVLARDGIAGALVATSLHDGTLLGGDIAAVSGPAGPEPAGSGPAGSGPGAVER